MNAVEKSESENRIAEKRPAAGLLIARPFHHYYIGLGSNIAPSENLPKAIELLRQYVDVESISMVWETPPAGSSGPPFLNAVISIRTQLSPALLKSLILRRIEVQLGRVRTTNKNAPRTIDLDILWVDGQVIDPLIWEQPHLTLPMADLDPTLTHPKTGETIKRIASHFALDIAFKPRPDILARTQSL